MVFVEGFVGVAGLEQRVAQLPDLVGDVQDEVCIA